MGMADMDADKKSGEEKGSALSSKLRDILPEDFDMSDIGAIDLKEAEAIAEEDLLILNEEELIEGLDEFDLIPLAGKPVSERQKEFSPIIDRRAEAEQPKEPSAAPGREPQRISGPALEKKQATDHLSFDATQTQIEKREEAAGKDTLPALTSLTKEGYYPEYDEYIIPDTVPAPAEALLVTKDKTAPEDQASQMATSDQDMPGRLTIQPVELTPSTPEKGKEPAGEAVLTPYKASEVPVASFLDAPSREEAVAGPREEWTAPASAVPAEYRVCFIDDAGPAESGSGRIFEEIDLDKIISGTAQVAEGSSYLLSEADAHEDRSRVVLVTEDTLPVRQDEGFHFGFRYLDEDLDYIHTAIVEEDYGDYMMRIDEFLYDGFKPIPESVELLGLTADEYDVIEDALFHDELQHIGRYQRYGLYEFDRATREAAGKVVKYLIPVEESLLDAERHSIENDISSESALVFEEDVESIREHLLKMGGPNIELADERTSASVQTGAEGAIAPDLRGMVEPASPPADENILRDITDRVVILNDEEDVERFVRKLPEKKRADMRTLLKYLDGLFERLPEEIIRKFASSEYFDLYLKVLNEMGV